MTVRVQVNPQLLEWACERAGTSVDALEETHPKFKLRAWIAQDAEPTLKQLEDFAKKTHTPIGYLFLPSPPDEPVPIPDFRTIAGQGIARPSPDLLDTIYICQQRQEWFREYARSAQEPAVAFIDSVDRRRQPEAVAAVIRDALGFNLDERRTLRTWTDALSRFIEQAEDIGVLVMVSGVVGSNNNRKLDPDEFRGFALSDPLAPLIFINSSDTKSAQMFTLAHELAHLWLGETALSDATMRIEPNNEVEKWCNQVAAELLVPLDAILEHYRETDDLTAELNRLARIFKVSTLVLLRRIYDAGRMPRNAFWAAYDDEVDRLRTIAATKSAGGNFYHTTATRVGKRFARAIIGSALEGRASFSEALHLLGFKKMATFKDLGRSVGVDI
ncbi:MAG: ImmA/IrrE family metallo-endopeptidase [Phycisphaerales bacterium]